MGGWDGWHTSVALAECGEVAGDGHYILPEPLGLHTLAPKPVVGVGQVGGLQYVLGHILCEGAVAELQTTPKQASGPAPCLVCALVLLSLSFINRQWGVTDAAAMLHRHELPPNKMAAAMACQEQADQLLTWSRMWLAMVRLALVQQPCSRETSVIQVNSSRMYSRSSMLTFSTM